ncbi:hypothetical protein ACFX1S_002667 [Malus domestica]
MENQGSSICFYRFLELRIASLRFGVADLDCRMEKLKSNCRKPAMETRQQHIQVDMVFEPEEKIKYFDTGLKTFSSWYLVHLCLSSKIFCMKEKEEGALKNFRSEKIKRS